MKKQSENSKLSMSKLYKPNLDNLNLNEYKIIDPTPFKSRLIDVAKSLDQEPKSLDLSSPKEKARTTEHDLATAKSFGELDGKLSKNDLWVEKKGTHLVFTDGFSDVQASSINPDFSLKNLQRNFGEDVSKYLKARNEGIDINGAEQKIQGMFNQEILKELKGTRQNVTTKISDIRYELATIQTAPKQSKNTGRQEELMEQKSKLLQKHQALTTEIASLEKGNRFKPQVDFIKHKATQVKLSAESLGQSLKTAGKGYKINRSSIAGMQSAQEVIGFKQAFTNKITNKDAILPSRLASLSSATKPVLKVSHSLYRAMSKIAHDPELSR